MRNYYTILLIPFFYVSIVTHAMEYNHDLDEWITTIENGWITPWQIEKEDRSFTQPIDQNNETIQLDEKDIYEISCLINGCTSKYGHQKTLKHHQEYVHYICKICLKQCKDFASVQKHNFKKHDRILIYELQCSLCDFKTHAAFKTYVQAALASHQRKYHNPKNSSNFKCPQAGCFRSYVNQKILNRHLEYKHYVCQLCSKQYENLDFLQEHNRNAHSRILSYQVICPICNTKITNDKQKAHEKLKIHISTQHNSHALEQKVEEEIKWPKPSSPCVADIEKAIEYFSPANFGEWATTLANEDIFDRELAEILFTQTIEQNKEMKLDTPIKEHNSNHETASTFKCTQAECCSCYYKNKKTLNTHLEYKHYICKNCSIQCEDLTTLQNHNLTIHKRILSYELTCPICNIKVAGKETHQKLNIHIQKQHSSNSDKKKIDKDITCYEKLSDLWD